MINANSASALVVNLSDFPGLSDALAGKGPGDTCEVRVIIRVEEMSGDTLRGAVTEVIPDGYQTVAEEGEPSKESGESSPMILVLREKNRK